MNDLSEPGRFTDEDIRDGTDYGALGPEYFAARRVADRMFEAMEPEFFKPLVDRAAEEFQAALWDKVRDYLIDDTSQNVQGAIRYMVEHTVFALLTGKQWALDQYPLAKYHDGQSVRMAIVEHCGAALIEKVKRDEVADHRATVANYRAWRNLSSGGYSRVRP
jgi:hypothetical protein